MPVILLDTDPGVDDALALLYLHRHPGVELAGIATRETGRPLPRRTLRATRMQPTSCSPRRGRYRSSG
jgi:inosine-uridine nucleoside N-ribohydrolase